MRRLGFDLSQYNSAANALDLQDIRRALGYAQWNVHGHSYGTRLALVAMRDAMTHRGPDDAGTFTAPGIALASRRLSIVDLSHNGHIQPGSRPRSAC